MPKVKATKATPAIRHAPLGAAISAAENQSKGKLKAPKKVYAKSYDDEEEDLDDGDMTNDNIHQISNQAKQQRQEQTTKRVAFLEQEQGENGHQEKYQYDSDEDYQDDVQEEDDYEGDDMVDIDGEYVDGNNLSAMEEELVNKFLHAGKAETRTLADIIMSKIKEKEEQTNAEESTSVDPRSTGLPAKVQEVYTSVGKMLAHYKAGKLPKALKMLPHLRNWEEVLWLTRPDEWSPAATYACTRIFASNLNEKMTQRFVNLVLLEKCRDDIRRNSKLNYHLYMACKKALFKPAAFYKGFLLPLAMSRTCSLREATIIGSVLAKVSIPANHSSAALLKLAEMPYSGSSSMFLRVLMNKKYALPRKVVDALVHHFTAFERESRVLPVIWHQALLVFAQRYKVELSDSQREALKQLLRVQVHHQITPEIRRELFNNRQHEV